MQDPEPDGSRLWIPRSKAAESEDRSLPLETPDVRQRAGSRSAVCTQIVIGEVSTGCSALSAMEKVIGARPSEAETSENQLLATFWGSVPAAASGDQPGFVSFSPLELSRFESQEACQRGRRWSRTGHRT